jgi:hypothetical protein
MSGMADDAASFGGRVTACRRAAGLGRTHDPMPARNAARQPPGYVASQSPRHGVGRRWVTVAAYTVAAAALLARAAEWLLRAHGGYVQAPLGERFRSLHQIVSIAPRALWQVLDLFGADFAGLRGVQLWLAVVHLVSVTLVIAAVVLVTSRYFGHRTLVDRMLVVAIVGLVVGYVITTASGTGAHEIAPVEPLAAALTARTLVALADRAAGVHPMVAPGQAAGVRRMAVPGWARRAGWAAGGLVPAGYLAGLGWEISQPATPPQFTGLASWLAAHHLTDGLATYWDASIVTIDSGGQVQVRALGGSALRPYPWMTDQAWYDPASGRADFLVLSSKPYFGGTWTQQQITARFGRSAHAYHIGVFTILVWHRNLLTSIGR